MLPKVIIGVVVLVIGFFAVGSNFKDNRPATQRPNQQGHQQNTPDLGAGEAKLFYNEDGLYLTHSWPGENNFSNEETEILIFNESGSSAVKKATSIGILTLVPNL